MSLEGKQYTCDSFQLCYNFFLFSQVFYDQQGSKKISRYICNIQSLKLNNTISNAQHYEKKKVV